MDFKSELKRGIRLERAIKEIEKLSEFIEYVEKLPEGFILSRGQSKSYKLLPTSLRKDEAENRIFSKQSINHFLKEFKINSYNYLDNPLDIKNEGEWMIMAQHYGIPTKLLDFTFSHMISLMFAVEKSFNGCDSCNAEVWFLNPTKLNLKYAKRDEILNLNDIKIETIENYSGPIAVKGRKLNSRINSQNGLFVCFQNECEELESLVDENILKCITIKGEYKKDILSSLYSVGMGYISIYPELESISKDIIMKNNINEYLKEGK